MPRKPPRLPPAPTDAALAVTRWQVRVSEASIERAREMAQAAGVTLQAVLLGAIRLYAESVLRRSVRGYIAPLDRPPRHAPEVISRRPVIRIPAAWLTNVIPAVVARTGQTHADLVSTAVDRMHAGALRTRGLSASAILAEIATQRPTAAARHTQVAA